MTGITFTKPCRYVIVVEWHLDDLGGVLSRRINIMGLPSNDELGRALGVFGLTAAYICWLVVASAAVVGFLG